MAVRGERRGWIQEPFQREMKETCLENIITIGFLSLQKTIPKSAFEDLSHGVIPAAMVWFSPPNDLE